MKNHLNHLNTVGGHAPDFDCDNDGHSDGPVATDQELITGSNTASSCDFQSSINCHLQSLTQCHLNIYPPKDEDQNA